MKNTILTIEDIYQLRDQFVENVLGITFYDYQRKVSNAIIQAILTGSGEEIPIEISRQAGKTESVVCTVCFLMTFSLSLTRRFWGREHPLRIIIWSPQREQAKTDFDRLKAYFQKMRRSGQWGDLIDQSESNQTTMQIKNGAYCYIFPLTPTSNPESKTADLQIFEEAHKIDDFEKKNKAEPMGASTNAPEISIGVSWYNKNYFLRLIQSLGKKHKLRFDADEVIKQRRERYEQDGNPFHLNYEKKFNKLVERDGREDPAIKTQWLLQWVLGAGQFMVQDDWNELTEPYFYVDGNGDDKHRQAHLIDEDKDSECFVGIDTAKYPDSTVVTVIRWNEETKWKELIALLELKGENYLDQFEIITGYDSSTGRMTGMGMLDSFNVQGIAIDSTGQGSFFPDMFTRLTRWRDERSGLFPVKFSLVSKDVMYRNLQQVVQNRLTAIPNDDTVELDRLREQLLDLQKEYKGELLSVHHPESKTQDGEEYHDDYPDSWALAEYAFSMRQRIAKPKIRTLNG